MPIIFYTGVSAPEVALVAATHAQYLAKNTPTLLFSIGPAHYLPFQVPPGITPHQHEPGLDVLAFDALAAQAALWEQSRATMPAQLRAIGGAELPTVPALDILLAFRYLETLADRYKAIIVIAAPHERLIGALALVDGLRWGVRLLFGLERGPGASSTSVARALVPTGLLPIDFGGAQALRLQAEAARARLTNPQGSSARFVLPAIPAALAEARFALPALQLHGMQVGALIVAQPNPAHTTILAETQTIWPKFPVLGWPASPETIGTTTLPPAAPIQFEHNGEPAVVIALPGLPPGTLQLTLNGDELIVQVGPYRRHLLLPESLRGATNIRATRENELLIVRKRG